MLFSIYIHEEKKENQKAVIRAKQKISVIRAAQYWNFFLLYHKIHHFVESSFLNQSNTTVKQLQAKFLRHNAVCVRTLITSG